MLSHWTQAKSVISDAAGLGRDVLHVPIGVAIFILLLWVRRGRPGAASFALIGLGLAQLINEGLDAVQWWSWTGAIPWQEAAKDTAITMSLPVMLTILLTRQMRANASETASPRGAQDRPEV